RMLADQLGWDFREGDDLHPQTNVDRMHAGFALEDSQRWPWLDRIAGWIGDERARGRDGVVSCSALKRSYRDRLRVAGADVRFVYLRVKRAGLERRMQDRRHFMPVSLLDSQLRTLEEPSSEGDALTVSAETTIDEIISTVREWLGPHRTQPHD
ncbi:MAG: gluconokinase, partial [Rhodanobacter sp.]